MQYLLMCCFEETRWQKLPESERSGIMSAYTALIDELRESGRLMGGAKLAPCASAVSIRERNGRPVITDGPFAETKEQLGGYHLIECRNREEAVAIATRIPTLAAGGAVEVRPIQQTE